MSESEATSVLEICRRALEHSCADPQPHLQVALDKISADTTLPRVLRIEARALLAEVNA